MPDGENDKKKDDVASEVLEHLKNPPVEVINPNKNSTSNSKKYLFIIVSLIILAVAGFAGWKFLLNDNNQTANNQPSSEVETQADSTLGEVSLSEPTQEYTSDRLLIDFKYPTGWTVDENSGEIVISSPAAEVTDVNGDEAPVEFKILIKQGADQSDSDYLGRGLAVKKSTPIKYTDPASGQREKTFVSDFGLDDSDNFAYFVVQGNFNLKKDETLGPDFAKEADAILISGGFYERESKDGAQLVSIDSDTYASNENYLTALEIVKTLRLR